MVPGGVRQQVVDPWRVQGSEGVVHQNGVVGHVHGAQQSQVQVPELRAHEQIDRFQHAVVTAAALAVQPVAVVRGAVAVEGNADLDVELRKYLKVTPVECHAIGVDPQIERGDRRDGAGQFLAYTPESHRPHEKWLAAVKNDRDAVEFLFLGVIGESPGRLRDGLVGDHDRPSTPALVRVFVYVTVIASKVAPTVNLQNKLPEREDCHSAYSTTH